MNAISLTVPGFEIGADAAGGTLPMWSASRPVAACS